MRVVVVGGGVIGLLSAYMLAGNGVQVVLLERGETGREASWAGGGIVSPLYPWRYSAAVSALSYWSQDFYPKLAQSLIAQTGLDPEVHTTGLYWFDLDDQSQALDWAAREAQPLHEVTMAQARAHVPVLGDGFSRAIYMPGVANVRNPRLVKTLRAALLAMANVEIHEQCDVRGFVQAGDGRICGVQTSRGEFTADQVVVAAGAWSAQLLQALGLHVPIEPVKGQMILYQCAEDFLPAMVLAKTRYAIPRRDGHILIGSTLEYADFDKTPTDAALASLQTSACELLPALADARVVKHWAGLRPGSPEGIPYIGEVAQHPGLWLNCGHFRNGLVLAPASCQLLCNLMLEQEPVVEPAPYAPASRLH